MCARIWCSDLSGDLRLGEVPHEKVAFERSAGCHVVETNLWGEFASSSWWMVDWNWGAKSEGGWRVGSEVIQKSPALTLFRVALWESVEKV